LKVDRGSGVNAGRTFAGELQFDVGAEDLGVGSTRRVSVGGAQKLIQFTRIDRQAASSPATEVPLPPSYGQLTLGGVRSL
jgi:hypothetical protein